MSSYYGNSYYGGYFPITTSGTTANITAISFPQIETQVAAVPEESDCDWLRRRISEVTELAVA